MLCKSVLQTPPLVLPHGRTYGQSVHFDFPDEDVIISEFVTFSYWHCCLYACRYIVFIFRFFSISDISGTPSPHSGVLAC